VNLGKKKQALTTHAVSSSAGKNLRALGESTFTNPAGLDLRTCDGQKKPNYLNKFRGWFYEVPHEERTERELVELTALNTMVPRGKIFC